MSSRPRIDDAQRRARLARRHAIAPRHRVATAEAVTAAMTVLHATEPATVYLSVAARSDLDVAAVDRALYTDRSLVKQLAMRRTLFVFPRELLPAAWGSASARVAAAEGRRIAKQAESHHVADDGVRWLQTAEAAVLAYLREHPEGATTPAIRRDVAEVAGRTAVPEGRPAWDVPQAMAPWVMIRLGASGLLTRGVHDGHWRTGSSRWVRTVDWLGEQPEPIDEAAGYAALVARWLRTFGPGTLADVQWWLGSTKTAARAALAAVDAVEVSLDSGEVGYVLPDDLAPDPDPEPWAALLPTLDPTTMGWKQRGFYLRDTDVPYLFDSVGNGGTTAWWNGRIVGCWVQDDDARVQVIYRHDPGAAARRALADEADRLTAWLDRVTIASVYKSAMMAGRPIG